MTFSGSCTESTDAPLARVSAPLNTNCIVCGHDNPHGLGLDFHLSGKEVSAHWTSAKPWESFRGIIHGGIISTVLDEAMSQAVIAAGYEALTAELRVRFHRKISIGESLTIQGRITAIHGRKITTESCILAPNGECKAQAWGIFLRLRPA